MVPIRDSQFSRLGTETPRLSVQVSSRNRTRNQLQATNVQKLDVPGPDEKFCLCWLCAFNKFSSGGAIFPVHLIFEHL